jgi:hypothetical protein
VRLVFGVSDTVISVERWCRTANYGSHVNTR